MAIERNTNSISLKLNSNYGTIGDKVVRKTKSYSGVKETATDAQIIATGKAIDNLQSPSAENILTVTTEELVETV